jgi:hypothetical protein
MKTNYSTPREKIFNFSKQTIANIALLMVITLISSKGFAQGATCAGATPITINGACLTSGSNNISDNTENSPNVGASSCLSGGNFRREGWYTFTVSAGPQVVTITANSANRNMHLQLISSSSACSGLSQIACANSNNSADSAQTETITSTLSNGIYYIKVTNINGSGGNSMQLSSICITATTPCVTPTAQPTALVLTSTTATIINGSFTAASPAPNKYLVIRSTSATAPSPAPVDGTTYSVGNAIGGGTVVATGSGTTFSDTSLAGNTRYYYYVYSFNDTSCSGVAYNTTSPLTNNQVTCSSFPTTVSTSGTTSSSFNLNWGLPAGGSAAAITYTIQVTTDAGYTIPITGSPFSASAPTGTLNVSGLSANTIYYYRILASNGCSSAWVTGNVTTLGAPCVAPSQATALTFGTITSTTIPGTITGTANGYLVIRSTSATPPSQPINGTNYSAFNIGTLGTGLTFIQASASTTINSTGLVGNTRYFYYIFAYNNIACTGGPVYATGGSLSGNAITCPAVPNAVTTSGITQTEFTLNWTAPTGGSASTVDYTIEVTTDAGYTLPISGSPFSAISSAISLNITGLNANTQYYFRILAKNGCSSAWVSGNITTLLNPCVAPSQATGFTLGTVTPTTLSASFSGTAHGYLVVRSTSATAPSQPVNGIMYSAINIGTLGTGLTFIQSSMSTAIADTGLTANTQYYYYVYAYNTTSCSGGPVYASSVLSGNGITCPNVPTSVNTSGITNSAFNLNWTAPTGGAIPFNYTIQVTTDAGYTAHIAGSPFTVSSSTITQTFSGLTANTIYYYRILAGNTSCNSAWVTGSITTTNVCVAPAQATGFTLGAVTATALPASFSGTANGYLVIRSTSATPPTQPVNGTTYSAANIATLGTGLTFIQASNATTIASSGLTANTQYYYYIFAYNATACTGGPVYATGGSLSGNGNTCPNAPTAPNTTAVTNTSFTINWTAPTGGSVPFSYTVQVTTDAGYTVNIAGSPFTVPSSSTTLNLTGLTANTTYHFRILAGNATCNSAWITGSRTTTNVCVAPAQATALTFGTITNTALPATFTGNAGANGYLVIRSLSATPPAQPVNGTTYSAANIATLGAGLTFVQSGASTSIPGSGLAGNTRYYYYVYAFNNGMSSCTGGPVYATGGALTGNEVTCPNVPNTVVANTITQTSFTLNWTAPTGGSALPITYIVQVTTDATYTTNIFGSPFSVPDPSFILDINDLDGNTTYYYRILTDTSSCDSAWVTGSITTLNLPCLTPTQAFNFTNGALTSTTYPASFLGDADAFLVIRSTSATPPTQPVNGTFYSAANIATLGAGLTFIQSGISTNISSTGLTANTRYYYYVFAYTNQTTCSGSPVYALGGALVGTGVTCPNVPTALNVTGTTTTGFTLNWTAPTGGSALPITYTVQITTNAGYTNNIAGSPFTVSATTLAVTGLASGTTYYYRILSDNGCQSAFVTGLTTTMVTNDNCATAIALTVNTSITCVTNTTGTSVGATQSLAGCTGTADDDVWYSFVANNTSHTVTVAPTAVLGMNDVVFQVFAATCTGTSLVCRNSTGGISSEAFTLTGLTFGTTYFVRIYSAANGSGRGGFTVCITTPVPPINNDCAGALTLTVNPGTNCVINTTGSTTQLATQSLPGCVGTADDDVWYRFTATGASHIVTVSPLGMGNPVFQVFSGSCASLTSLGCRNNSAAWSGIETSTLSGLTVGTTYFVRVYSFDNAAGQGPFNICVTTPCSPGSGTGTSDTTCPNIVAGGAGLNGANPTTIPCYAPTTCANLEAIYPEYYLTTSYSVTSIPYNPPYQFNCLANPVSVNTDDVWSPIVNLPFNFCFYGNSYNRVLIGSNGTITFDLTTYAPGGFSAWAFNTNLPSSSLFLNSIFGVYHDIDPEKGGQIGWELVTLSSGCRALVAGWSDVPMYSPICNDLLYTGMIVLHENSNVIDVFIKEKNVCSSWNGGNAVVGIQNANGTQAVVAPNRNSLNPDWTINEEAWRFNPSGAPVSTIRWYEGAGTTGPVVGTTANITVCPTTSTVYTAEVTYAFCSGQTLRYTDQTSVTIAPSKTWTGAIDTDWSKAGNWNPSGAPTNTDCITIPDVANEPIISGSSYSAVCYNLTVNNASTLEAQSSNSLTVTDFVRVNTGGLFTLRNSSSLVQINNTATNTGNIVMERTTNMRRNDYVYWSTPVRTFNSGNISPLSPAGFVFKWNPTITNGNGGQGNWVAGTEVMAIGGGYIVIGPSTFSASTPSPFTATFTGIPNNGIRRPTISRGSYTGADYLGNNGVTITNLDDNWNLVGNPYPSAIDALDFLNLNTNINGNVRLWTHGTPLSSSNSNTIYSSYAFNYNVNDYVTYNGTGSTPPGFNGKIGAAQSFLVTMNDGPTASSTVTFNNSLRNAAHNNSQFYRQANATTSSSLERNRIWLSLAGSNNIGVTTLVGYVDNATLGEDRLFDASYKVTNALAIYSWIDDKSVLINGRPTPFDDSDVVPLGATIPSDGNYTIGIAEIDGLFASTNQEIYLEDTELNVIHDLRLNPYTFSALTGNYDNRFKLRYQNATLGTVGNTKATTFAYITNHNLHVKSNETIKEIVLHDISGKLVKKIKPTTEMTEIEEEFPYQNGVYLATIIKTNGEKTTVKLLN